MEENKKRRKRDIVKKTVSDTLHKAKESLIHPYYKALDKFNKAFLNAPQQITLNWDKYMHIRIRVFHSQNQAEVARICLSGQSGVLKEFGVNSVSSASGTAWQNKNTYLILLEDVKTGVIGGGMRLDVATPDKELPIEKALKSQYPDITKRIHKFDHIIAETCGLWISKEFSERKLAKYLMISAITVAPKIRVDVLVGLANTYSLPMTLGLGFTVAKTVGDNGGQFYYPDNRYLSTVVELNAFELDTVAADVKELILNLRETPKQSFRKEHNGYITQLDYDLRVY